jgi:hypothetical protein
MNRKSRIIRFFVFLLVIFPMLGCVSISYFVDMDADASGKGTIYLKVTAPDIGDAGASSFDKYMQQLTGEGWENIEIGSPGNNQIELTANYRLDAEAGRGFPNSMKNNTITVEESEIGYRIFTYNSKFDFTQLQTTWDKIKNSNDPDYSFDLGEWSGGKKTVITREQIDEFIRRYGEPTVNYKIRLPGNTPVDAKGLWSNRQDYLNGKADTIEFTWKPGMKTTGTLMVSRRYESKPAAAPEQMAGNLNQLTQAYLSEIPTGWPFNFLEIPTGGWFNNIVMANIWNENYTCGSYQNYVMDFLDRVRTSPDANVRNMLAGYEYGPIQTNGGGHVAVVVFPAGSDWTKTGTVLDPWPTQKPAVYDIRTWFLALGLYAYSGYNPEPSYGTANLYPQLTGKPASYPAENDVKRPAAQPVKQILVINSPVTVMVELKDGRQIGIMPGKSGINQSPQTASFYALPNDDGGKSWFFFLPADVSDVTVYGQDEGKVHIALVKKDGINGFEEQTIHEGESANFSIGSQSNPGNLTFEGGKTVKPVSIQKDRFAEIMGVTKAAAAPQKVPTKPAATRVPTYNDDDIKSGSDGGALLVLLLCCCCCPGTLLVVVVIVIIIVSNRKKKVADSRTSEFPGTG